MKVLPLCNQIESEVAELDQEERLGILKEMGMNEPGLNRLIRESYEMLNLLTFFTTDAKN